MGWRDSNTWFIFCCFPRHYRGAVRKLEQLALRIGLLTNRLGTLSLLHWHGKLQNHAFKKFRFLTCVSSLFCNLAFMTWLSSSHFGSFLFNTLCSTSHQPVTRAQYDYPNIGNCFPDTCFLGLLLNKCVWILFILHLYSLAFTQK